MRRVVFLLLFLLQDQCSSFSDKGNPMVMNAIGFLLIVFFLAALSYNLLRMDSHGLQTMLSIYWTAMAEAFPSALFTKEALCLGPLGVGAGIFGWLQLSLPCSRRGHQSLAHIYWANSEASLADPCAGIHVHATGWPHAASAFPGLSLAARMSRVSAWAPAVSLLLFVSLSDNTYVLCFTKLSVRFRLLRMVRAFCWA